MEKLKSYLKGVSLLLFGVALGTVAHSLHADQDNIKNMTVANIVHAKAVSAGGTYTSSTFKALEHTTNQSAQVQWTGTSPNYKVEILVSLDGTTFTKPETGGDLGTFTDANPHVVALYTPACILSKLKFTELGGANSGVAEAYVLSQ